MELACLVNGEISAHLPVGDRGLAYGDGVFETIPVLNGRPCFWQEHMDRLARGCSLLDIDAPPQEILLRETLTVAAGAPRCVVKIIVTRGAGGRGYAPARDLAALRVVAAYEFPAGVAEARRAGRAARTCSLRLALQPAFSGIKHLSRLEQVLASLEMREHPGQEGILLNHAGYVVSAISGNLFLVFGRQLITPRMDRSGVRGVVRGLLLRDFKARCELRRVTPDMLAEADEVFICNAVRGIVPLVRIDAQEWPVGTVTRELQDWFERRQTGTG
jgi:4-amino-4-deoxychorismate lyase